MALAVTRSPVSAKAPLSSLEWDAACTMRPGHACSDGEATVMLNLFQHPVLSFPAVDQLSPPSPRRRPGSSTSNQDSCLGLDAGLRRHDDEGRGESAPNRLGPRPILNRHAESPQTHSPVALI